MMGRDEYVDAAGDNADDQGNQGMALPIPLVGSASSVVRWEQALLRFLRQGGDFSEQTRLRYDWCVRIFFRHPVLASFELSAITPELLREYRAFLFARTQPGFKMQHQTPPEGVVALPNALTVWAPLPKGRKSQYGVDALSAATVNVRLVAMRSYLQFCRKHGWLDPRLDHDTINDCMPCIKEVASAPSDILLEHEWQSYAEAARAPARDDASGIRTKGGMTGAGTWRRDHAIVTLFLATGLRRSELVNLNTGNFTRERDPDGGLDQWWLTLEARQTKGGYSAGMVPIAQDVIAVLAEYLREEGRSWKDRASPLFLSTHASSGGGSRRLNPHTINCVINRITEQWRADKAAQGDDLENRNIHPHSTRASTAVALMKGNKSKGRGKAGLHDVQRFLRHSNPNTTDRYLRKLDAGEQLRPFSLAIEAPTQQQPPQPTRRRKEDATGETDES